MVYKKEYYGHSGTKVEKYYDGILLHREDGPAIIYYYESGKIEEERYFVDGIQYEDIFLYSVEVGSLRGE